MKLVRLLLLPVLFTLPLVGNAPAQLKSGPGDWPGWRGPDRTDLSPEKNLLTTWPAGGPKLLWKVTGLGDGYSTPSIFNDVLYTLGTRDKGQEALFALDLKNKGKILRSTPMGKEVGSWKGPRSTPTVDGDLVYALGSDGFLLCASADKGEVRWTKSLTADFGGKHGNWAYAESPLVDGDNLIVTPGGSKATIVALNKKSGAVIWKTAVQGLREGKRPGNFAGYASAIVVTVAGVRQYIQFLDGGVVGVEAATGKHLWTYAEPANQTANCSTVLYHEGSVFAASAYGNGGGLAKLVKTDSGFKAEQAYFVKQMQNHHGGMVLLDGFIYGTNGSELLCVELSTGQVVWTDKCVGKGSVAYADGHLIVRSEAGPIALVEANPKEYKEKGRFDQPDRSAQKAWPHPVIAGGKLYIRDWDTLLCYDISAK